MYAAADLPRRHRLSVADYYRMAEVGILDPDARVELIDGDIIDMAPPGSPHAAAVHYLNDVLLIVEVSATSLRFDRETKSPLYARHGIPELWLVDLGGRRLSRYRTPQHGSYSLVDEPDLGAALEISALAGMAVDLQRLFG
jgi:Uma2 family endonuclease